MLNDEEIKETFKDLFDVLYDSPKIELLSYKSLLVERLKRIPPFNQDENFSSLDDLVIYINSNSKKKESNDSKSIIYDSKGKKKKKKEKESSDDAFVNKFKTHLQQESVPLHKVSKIEINISKDWIYNIQSK
jgi:uncharacterized protein (UPF0248 family)